MAKANSPTTLQTITVQQAAAEIAALINTSPRSPWPSEIEAIVAKAAQVRLIRDLDTEPKRGLESFDEATAVDHATWRKLVIEAETTLRAKDLKVGDPRLPAAEAICDAAYERLHAFEAANWERPARSLGDLPFLADLLVYQMAGICLDRRVSGQ